MTSPVPPSSSEELRADSPPLELHDPLAITADHERPPPMTTAVRWGHFWGRPQATCGDRIASGDAAGDGPGDAHAENLLMQPQRQYPAGRTMRNETKYFVLLAGRVQAGQRAAGQRAARTLARTRQGLQQGPSGQSDVMSPPPDRPLAPTLTAPSDLPQTPARSHPPPDRSERPTEKPAAGCETASRNPAENAPRRISRDQVPGGTSRDGWGDAHG